MNATEIITSLNKWNSRQELRQKNMTNYGDTLKSALKRSHDDELKSIELWSKALLFNN